MAFTLVAAGRASNAAPAIPSPPDTISNVSAAAGGAVILGRGYDSINGALVTQALSPISANTPSTGYHLKAYLVHITDEESLFRETDISADGSLHYGMFSASANYNFSSQSKYSSFNNYLLAKVYVEQEPQTLASYDLNDNALRAAEHGTPRGFYATFGDSFVSDLTLGGYLFALITFNSTSKAEHDESSASLSFGMMTFGDVDASFISKLSSFSDQTNTTVVINKNGGSQTLPNINSLTAEFQNFAAQVSSGAATKVVTSYRVLDFEKTTNKPAGFSFLRVDPAVAALKQLASRASLINQWQGDLSFLHDHPEQFDAYDAQIVGNETRQLASEETRIDDLAAQIVSDPFDVPPFSNADLNFVPLPTWRGVIPLVIRVGYPGWDWTPYDKYFGSDEWAGNRDSSLPPNAVYRGIYAVGVAMKNPIPGLTLNYEVTNLSGKKVAGADGQFINPNQNNAVTGDWIVSLRVWLSGPRAGLYRVSYRAWKIYVGPTAASQDGGPCVADSGPFACLNCSPAAATQRIAGKQLSAIWIDIRGKNEPVPQ
jgi:hypothetical protein